ncbi:hypothetical protein [Halovulum sp. GXIMD14793]
MRGAKWRNAAAGGNGNKGNKMNFLKSIFGTINRRYLVRAYVIGLAFYGLILVMLLNSDSEQNPSFMIGVLTISLLLFPFAKLVWDELRDFIMGDTIIFQSVPMHFIGKYL